MKKLLTLSLMAVVLALGSTAQAADSQVIFMGALADNPAVTWGDYLSGSWAVAAGASGTDDNSQFLPGPDTYVTSAVPGASAIAGTSADMIGGQAFATTAFGTSGGYAYAQQERQFTAAGTATFTLDFGYSHVLNANPALGESAYADTSAGIYLYDAAGNVLDFAQFYDINSGTGSFGDTGSLTVSGNFGEGGIGSVLIRMDGQAVAAVPAPGALLLGALGTGLVGFLRRRVF